jgi:hypothetical protein
MAESNGADASSSSSSSSGSGKFDVQLWDQVELVYQRVTKGRHDLKRIKTYCQTHDDAHTNVAGSERGMTVGFASERSLTPVMVVVCLPSSFLHVV